MSLTVEDFCYVSDLARENAAIVIESGKEYFIESRLTPLAVSQGCESLRELIALMRGSSAHSGLHVKAIDALTTNETFFFRDVRPFEALRDIVIPRLLKERAGERRLSIWSAACSTGQEPYSIAMLLREHFPQLANWDVSILATDLSERVLSQARSGCYNHFEVKRGLAPAMLFKYFSREGEIWRINESVRQMVDFRRLNLIGSWPLFRPFDVVFLRNVMIYFDVVTKKRILARIRKTLSPHGALFLGSAETTMNLDSEWMPVRFGKTTAYQVIPAECPVL